MPVPLRANHHRAEAKYNVTTDFPNFGLHSAASTGDVGLVEYALSRGQPVNSVVDGVLPLHAACAGGNVHVVKLLIDYCADVNAPRLPKRYSSRDSSAPIIGTTGSTPLHFAAANGNRDAIKLLLRHGAHANRADKHGVTPEALARENGWIECADLLKEWIINKDKDLREREEFVATNDRDDGRRRNRMGSVGDAESSSTTHRHRLHVKQSIDTALNMLRSSSSNLGENYRRSGQSPTPPTSPTRPFGDFTSELGNNNQFPDLSTRRPSLPPADSFPRVRKPSARSEHPHRPRSAGEGADQGTASPVPSYGRGPTRKVGSKVSLLNLFRKGQNSETPTPPESSSSPAPERPSLSTSPTKGAAINSSSYLSHHRSRLHQDSDASIRSRATADTSLERKSSLNSPSRSPVPLAVDQHNALAQGQQINNRDRSRSNASSRYEYLNDDPVVSGQGSYPSAGSSPLARLGLLRNQHHRARSGSGSSLTHEANVPSRLAMSSTTPKMMEDATNHDDDRTGGVGADTDNISRSLPRSGILRPHNRSGSGGQNHMTPSALRALRFDAPSANGNGELTTSFSGGGGPISYSPSPRSTPAKLKSSNSVGSLGRSDSYTKQRARRRPGSAGSMSGPKQSDVNDEEREVIEERVEEDEGDEGEEEEYGKPIEATVTPSLLIGAGAKISSTTSLSPIIPNGHTNGGGEDDTLMADFPFSINRPPPISVDGEVEEKDILPPRLTARVADTRNRGDSLSSGGTVDSQPTSSAASTRMVVTPVISSEAVPPSDKREEVLPSGAEVIDAGDEDGGPQYIIVSPANDLSSPSARPGVGRPGPLPLQKASPPTHSHDNSTSNLAPPSTTYSSGHSSTGSMSGRRTHTPFDIDISSISSHAQAEALVEKARREVMELANMEEQDLPSETGNDGRTPLSARLAAYGESLALERKFRELEKGLTSAVSSTTTSTMPMSGKESIIGADASSTNLALPVVNQRSADGSGYSASLYSGRSASGTKDTSPRLVNVGATVGTHMKRPSTAEGLAPRDANLSLSSEQSDQSYQSSRSASAMGHRRGAESNPYHQFAIPTLNVPSSSDEDNGTYHRPSPSLNYITRSRTPTADYGDSLKPGRMASLDGVEYNELALSRVSTAPSPVRLPPPGRSARKLAKMGISVVDQTNKAAPAQSLGHSGGRFGAIKSLFKGKS